MRFRYVRAVAVTGKLFNQSSFSFTISTMLSVDAQFLHHARSTGFKLDEPY